MLLKELKIKVLKKMKFFLDNQLVIDLESNLVCHGISKNIGKRYRFLMDQVNKGNLDLEHCKS